MGAYDYMMNAVQSGQINDLIEKVEKLEKDLETARAWIEHLTERVEKLERYYKMTAGAKVVDDFGGYEIGTKEAYDEFVKNRNYKIPGTEDERS